jgi:catechol 2,3-dioxygenase-like lactoylglutathione lyase family enzyme
MALINNSEEKADKFYKEFLGLNKLRCFEVSAEMAQKIFNLKVNYKVIVYSNDQFRVEIFIDEKYKGDKNSIPHVCIEVKDREKLILKAEKMGIDYTKIPKQNSYYLFIRDYNGNLFEVKDIT